MDGYMEDYNAKERARFAMEFERTIDAMQIISPSEVAATATTIMLNANLINFWVNVTKQPVATTELIRKHTQGLMPTYYNNIAIYYPGQKIWGLKFSCN